MIPKTINDLTPRGLTITVLGLEVKEVEETLKIKRKRSEIALISGFLSLDKRFIITHLGFAKAFLIVRMIYWIFKYNIFRDNHNAFRVKYNIYRVADKSRLEPFKNGALSMMKLSIL